MPNIKSAEKRVRQTKTLTLLNKASKTRVKSSRKALKSAIDSGDKAAATAQYKKMASAADRAAKKGVIHRHAASRLKSLYAKQIAAIA